MKKKVTITLDESVEAAVREIAKQQHRPFSSEIEMTLARVYLPMVTGADEKHDTERSKNN